MSGLGRSGGPDAPPRGICVVGGGLAAVSTAAELRARGFDGTVTILCAENAAPYDRPPLSKAVLLGRTAPDATALHRPEWYTDNAVDLRLGTRATALDVAGRRVMTEDGGAVPADAVVLATGGTPRRLPAGPVPQHVLRTSADAARLRDELRPGVRVLAVGAGLVGAEIAASATALGAHVTLVDPVPLPLEPAVGTEVARALHDMHAAHGVRVLPGTIGDVRTSATDPVLATVDTLEERVRVAADLLVVGIGIVPDTALAATAGVQTARGVLVDDARRTSRPGVYAVGDAAEGRPGALRPRLGEHWENAVTDGRAAAAAILAQDPSPHSAPWFWSDRYGAHLEAVGDFAAAERTVVRGGPGSGAFTVFGLRGAHCVAASGIDRGADIRAARRLIDRRVPVRDAELADEHTPLKALLRARPAAPTAKD